jgi:hypothetical protein
MRNLRRRIEAIEKWRSARQNGPQAAAVQAVERLRPDVLEPLISAYGADRIGRPLTEREAEARRAFAETLKRECPWAGMQWVQACGDTAYIHRAIFVWLAAHFPPEELELASNGFYAALSGDAPKEAESAAMQACTAQHERLCQLAGFGSGEEFRAFSSQGGSQETATYVETERKTNKKRRATPFPAW